MTEYRWISIETPETTRIMNTDERIDQHLELGVDAADTS